MTGSRVVRLSALGTATALLVLGAPGSASAQCSYPNYRGGRSFPGGSCPEHTAGIASGTVWAVLVLAAGVWLALLLSRMRSTTTEDLAVIDGVFSQAAADGGQPVTGAVGTGATGPVTATAAPPRWAPPAPQMPPPLPQAPPVPPQEPTGEDRQGG